MRRAGLWAFVGAGLAVAAALVFALGPRASSQPDGLERVAIDQGFADQGTPHALEGLPTADYGVEGVGNDALSTGLAGVAGMAVTFGVGWALVAMARRRRRSGAARTPS